ncbi:MAG: SufE family protein [Terricaulis sp.]
MSITQATKELADEFALLPDWEERIAYVIDLGKALAPLSEDERNESTRVRGCVSRVWLVCETRAEGKLYFRGDSDAHLVRGEIALLLRLFSGRTPAEIVEADPPALFTQLGLKDALTMQRSNGLFAMMTRMQICARNALQSTVAS